LTPTTGSWAPAATPIDKSTAISTIVRIVIGSSKG
jgi:hypothetical protein